MIEKEIYENGIVKAKKIRKLKKRGIILGISLLMIFLVTLAIFIIKDYYKDVNTLKYDDYELYQYFGGVKYNYKGNVSIEHDDTITSIKSDNLNIDVDSTPIYFQNIENEVLFPINMELVFLKSKTQNYRLNYFSKIMYDLTDDIESAFLVTKGGNKYLDTAFLYDGNDLYFFPYSTDITIDNIVYHLSPLSYVKVCYKDSVEIYNKKEDKYFVIDSYEKDIIANYLNYNLNLSTDMVMYKENDNRLLIKSINKLNLYDDTIDK